MASIMSFWNGVAPYNFVRACFCTKHSQLEIFVQADGANIFWVYMYNSSL